MAAFKVALVNPKDITVPSHSYGIAEHLGLAYLAAYLRQNNIEVKIIDGDVENLSIDEIFEEIKNYNPNLVGITGLIRTISYGLSLAEKIKKESEDIFVCVGGQHATYAAEEILLNHSSVDCVIRGEGEITLLEVLNCVKEQKTLDGVKGLYFMSNGQVVKNADRPAIEDLDMIPFPARDSLEKSLKKGLNLPVISILTSRGCPGGCSFCNSSTFFSLGGGKSWRYRSPKNVVDEIEMLIKKYHSDNTYWVVHIYDDNFIGSGRLGKERARGIAQEMISRGLKVPFDIFCRVDSFKDDEELIRLLKEAGLVSTFIGLESGSSDTLKLYNKGTTPEQNIQAVKKMEQYNIATPASGFIMFHPYVTFDELRENAKFLLDIGHATFWNLSVSLILFRGTKLVERVRKDNLIGEMIYNWAAYDYNFLDPRMKEFSQAMSFNNHSVLIRLDSAVRYVQNMVCKLDEQLQNIEAVDIDWSHTRKHREELKKRLHNIQEFSVSFFLACAEIFEYEDKHKFIKLKGKYIEGIDRQIDQLNESFTEYLQIIDKAIA